MRISMGADKPRVIQVDATHSGQRLDNFLLGLFKGVPRSHIYRILRRGEVRINKGRSTPGYRLRMGDLVRLPPVRMAHRDSDAAPLSPAHRSLVDRVVYEDSSVLVLDKPSGLAVHSGTGISVGIIEALRRLRPDIKHIELVHRLDRDTSGCLLLAKDRTSLTSLHALLREPTGEKRITKYYTALVKGQARAEQWESTAAIRRGQVRGGERMVTVAHQGQAATTKFVRQIGYVDATLVRISLLTGRTHQARVHAAHAGHPVAGDPKYGDREFNQRMRGLGLERLFLHASEVRFPHPRHGRLQRVHAPLPPPLCQVLARLGDEVSK